MVEVGRLLAEVQPGPGGRTELCIAGLVGRRSYQTQSDGGTRSGIELYEWFLTSVDDQLRAADSSARLEMGQA